MASPVYSTWHAAAEGSTFRPQGSSSLGWWVTAAVITSIGVHLGLWHLFQNISLPDYFAETAQGERVPVDLRRARINEEAAAEPAPQPQPIERPEPLVQEPVDITQLAKALPEMELRATPETDVAKNITLSPKPSAGALEASASSLLEAVPTQSMTSSLSAQIGTLPERLSQEPQISEFQVTIPINDGLLSDSLEDTVGAAVKEGSQGEGDADGFASLDDLLSYKGPVTEDKTAMLPTDLLFEYNSAELRDSARLSLMKLGFIIQRNPDAAITIEGHTDLFGGDEYNQRLSEARAEAVKNWLVESLRLDPAKLRTLGWGESKPIVPSGSIEEQAKNRRVEFVIRPKG